MVVIEGILSNAQALFLFLQLALNDVITAGSREHGRRRRKYDGVAEASRAPHDNAGTSPFVARLSVAVVVVRRQRIAGIDQGGIEEQAQGRYPRVGSHEPKDQGEKLRLAVELLQAHRQSGGYRDSNEIRA